MSSTSNSLLTGIRKLPTATSRFKALAEAMAAVKQKITDVDKLDFMTLNATCASYMDFVDPEVNMIKQYSTFVGFKVAIEPDLNFLKVALALDNPGIAVDSSKFIRSTNRGRTAFIVGSPTLVSSVDLGYGQVPALHLDGLSQWVDMPSIDVLTITGKPNGFTICIRINPDNYNVDAQGGGTQRIFAKRDDNSNALFAAVETNGDIVFHVKKAGTEFNVMWGGAANVFAATKWGELQFVFTGSAASINLNGVVKTTTSTYTTETYPSAPDVDFHIGRSSSTENNRFVGGIQGFRIYSKPLSAAEQANYFTNKLTIASIPFGQVAVMGHSFLGIPIGGFTATGFTDQGFTESGFT